MVILNYIKNELHCFQLMENFTDQSINPGNQNMTISPNIPTYSNEGIASGSKENNTNDSNILSLTNTAKDSISEPTNAGG